MCAKLNRSCRGTRAAAARWGLCIRPLYAAWGLFGGRQARAASIISTEISVTWCTGRFHLYRLWP
eukprot:1725938-Alexandrium_andersonii.AAC.1